MAPDSSFAQGPSSLVLAGGDPKNIEESVLRQALGLRADAKPLCVLAITPVEPTLSNLRRQGNDADVTVAWRLGDGAARVASRDCGAVWLQNDQRSAPTATLLDDSPLAEFWQQDLPWIAHGGAAALVAGHRLSARSPKLDENGFPSLASATEARPLPGLQWLPQLVIEPEVWNDGRFARLLLATLEADGKLALGFGAGSSLTIDSPASGEATAQVGKGSSAVIVDLGKAITWDPEGGFLDGRLWLLGDGDTFQVADRWAKPAPRKKTPEVLDELFEVPANVWRGDGFYRTLIDFALHQQDELRLGVGRGRAVLRKLEDFDVRALGSAEPRAVFAGPLALDWIPAPINGSAPAEPTPRR